MLGVLRMLRGGGWFNRAAFCCAAFRYDLVPGNRSYGLVGIRCARGRLRGIEPWEVMSEAWRAIAKAEGDKEIPF